MDLSETIMAAMIGALATVTTALFQLFSTIKEKRTPSKVDVRPKKGSTMRSVLAVLALMVASAAGGFLYSELIKQRSEEDISAMRGELKELRTLIANEKEAARVEAAKMAEPVSEPARPLMVPAAAEGVSDSVESVVYIPACRAVGATACGEQDAQRIALCGTIPSYARVEGIQLFAQPNAMQHPWEQHQVSFEQDLGGARFTGNSFEYAQGADLKAVCVNFMQWSSEHPHIARIVVQFGFGAAAADQPTPAAPPIQPIPSPATTPTSPQAPTVIAAESLHTVPTAAALSTTSP
ncbi:hypothetical protein JM946_28480 [Steroidobacter sp. S1-65]|uniref:Uncharacterized protein n=1 Tax=Steroidobacter gossypii TaxID=2805490 RepID=A0ABS1X630_9GAMM|nr:hypothetical protein [Steroidobacter gossypii]MBM0108687.1 hypothetical protein [Steroidobacter gossypii]